MVNPRTTQEIEEQIQQKELEAKSQETSTEAEALQMENQIQGTHQDNGMSKSILQLHLMHYCGYYLGMCAPFMIQY